MSLLSVVLGDGTNPPMRAPRLAALIASLLEHLRPGDEVICPLPPPAGPTLHALRQAVAGWDVAVFGSDNPDGMPPPGAMALRLLLPGARAPAGGIVGCALARARGRHVLWLPGPVPADPAALPRLRAALDGGADLAVDAGGLMLLRRELLHRAVLPLPEAPQGLERAAFFWRALLGARQVHGPVDTITCATLFGAPPELDRPEAIFALVDPLEALITQAGGDSAAIAAAHDWLLSGVARDLGTLPFWQLWDYATAALPFARQLAPSRPDANSAANALAVLAEKPLWHVVLGWQAMRQAGRAPGAGQQDAVARAQALWADLCRAR